MQIKPLNIAILSAFLVGMAPQRLAAGQGQGPFVDSGSNSVQIDDYVATAKPSATAPNSFVERFLESTHNGAGFSLGITESYAPEFGLTGRGQKSTAFTTLSPRFFFGTIRRRTQLEFDYSYGYRQYNHQNLPSSSTHSGAVIFHHTVSPKVNLSVANELRSAVNDQGLSLGSQLTVLAASNFSQLLYVPRGRTTTEQLRSNVDYRVGKRTNLNVFGSYYFARYHASILPDTHSVEAGIHSSYQVNRWLFLDNTFSHTLSGLNASSATNIQRLQLGGLRFQSHRGLELALGGGVESAQYLGKRNMMGDALVSLTKTAASTSVSIRYHRGFSLAIGPSAVLKGDNISLSATRWLGKRMNLQFNSTYTRGNASDTARLDTISTDSNLEIALGSHLLLIGQYLYLSQRSARLSSAVPNVSQNTGSIGLQYFLPFVQ